MEVKMEEQKKGKCVYCGNYRGYYTKAPTCFKRESCGYCTHEQKVVKNGDTCEKWRKMRPCYGRKSYTSRALLKIMEDLAAIRQIFEEDREEEEIYRELCRDK